VRDAGDVDPAELINCGLFDPSRKIPDVRRWLSAETYARPAHDHQDDHRHDPNRHDERIRAFTLASDVPIRTAAFEMFIDLLRSLHGPKLLRLKGIVQIAEEPEQPLVIHGVQHVMHPPVRLEGWPDDDRTSRIVLITRDLSAGMVEPLFRAFLNRPAPDQADRAAILDNPLVPFGGRDH
jgi:G3E family GTPase